MRPPSIWRCVDDPVLRHAATASGTCRARGTPAPSLPSGSTLLFVGTPSRTRVAVAAAEHAEVRVVGVVLLHVDDDVLDLRQQVGALGPARVGPVAGLAVPVVMRRMRQVGQPRFGTRSPSGRSRRLHLG